MLAAVSSSGPAFVASAFLRVQALVMIIVTIQHGACCCLKCLTGLCHGGPALQQLEAMTVLDVRFAGCNQNKTVWRHLRRHGMLDRLSARRAFLLTSFACANRLHGGWAPEKEEADFQCFKQRVAPATSRPDLACALLIAYSSFTDRWLS